MAILQLSALAAVQNKELNKVSTTQTSTVICLLYIIIFTHRLTGDNWALTDGAADVLVPKPVLPVAPNVPPAPNDGVAAPNKFVVCVVVVVPNKPYAVQ